MTETETLPATHSSISAKSWVSLVEQIDTYRRSHSPNGYSDLRVALDIALDMARVARKQGIQTYTSADVLLGSKPELVGPFTKANTPGRRRDDIFDVLAQLPFIEVGQESGSRTVRLKIAS